MNLYKIKRAIVYIPELIMRKINPIKLAKFKGMKIGKNVHFYGNVKYGTDPFLIELGNDVFVTDGVSFINHDGGTLILRNKHPKLEITKKIIVGNNVYIGSNSIILPGVTIGNNVIIAAGSVVSKNIPNDVVYGGVPAKLIKTLGDYENKILLESLEIGDLSAMKKEKELKKIFGVKK